MNHRGRTFLFALFAAIFASPAVWAADTSGGAPTPREVLSEIPDEAIAIAALRSLSEAETSIGAFMDAIQPGSSKSIGRGIRGALDAYGEGVGIDSSAPLAVCVVPIAPREVTVLTFLPMSDYPAWRDYWQGSIKTQEGGGPEYFERRPGRPIYFKPLDNGACLAVSDSPVAIALPGRPEGALSEARIDAISSSLSQGLIAASISIPNLLKAFPDLPDSILQHLAFAAPGAGALQAGAFKAKAFAGVIRDIVTGTDRISVSLSPDESELAINASVRAVPNTFIERLFREQGKADFSDIAFLPANPLLAFSGSLRGDTAWNFIEDFYFDMAESFADDPQQVQSAKAAISRAMGRLKSAGIGDNMTFSLQRGGGESPLTSPVIYRTRNAGAAVDAVAALVEDPDFSLVVLKAAAVSGVPLKSIKVSDETIDNLPVKVVSQTPDYPKAPEMRRGLFSRTFGETIVTRLAAKDNRVLGVLGTNPSLMGDLLEASKGGPGRIDMQKVERSTRDLGDALSGIGLISAPDYLAWALSLVASAPSKGVTVPATDRFAAFGYSFDGGAVSVRVRVPVEQIRAANAVGTQIMMRGSEGFRSRARTSESTDLGMESTGGR